MRHRLRAIERQQGELAEEQDRLNRELADSFSDHRRLAEIGERLDEVSAVLAALDEEWLDLASEAEARGLNI